jgi:glucokinase
MSQFLIGMDVGGTRIKAALFTPELTPVQEIVLPTEAIQGPKHVIHRMKESANTLIHSNALAAEQIQGMGIGFPGLLDPQSGVSFFSPNLPGWEKIALVSVLAKEYSFPLFLENDVRMNLYGEWCYGAGKGLTNLVLVTLGTGLGAAILNEGKIMYGTTWSAGEIGHMMLHRGGRPCRCGSSGCLGRYVSAVGMIQTLRERLQQQQTSIIQEWVANDETRIEAHMISQAYDLGDRLAQEVMQETGELLGLGLKNAINLLNPQCIIIGGGLAAAGERLLAPTRATVAQHALKIASRTCTIVQAELGWRAGMIGAAAYARDKLPGLTVRPD